MSVEKTQLDEGGVYKIDKDCHLRDASLDLHAFRDNSNSEFNRLQARGSNAKKVSPQKHEVIKKLKKGKFVKITSTLKNIFKIYFFNREHTRVKCIENGNITNIEGDMRTDCIGEKVDFTEGKMDFLIRDPLQKDSSLCPNGSNTELYLSLIEASNIKSLQGDNLQELKPLQQLKLLQFLKLSIEASQSKAWFWDKYPALKSRIKNNKQAPESPLIIKRGDRADVKNWIVTIEADLANSDDWGQIRENKYFQSIENYEAQAKSNTHFERLLKKDLDMPASNKEPSDEKGGLYQRSIIKLRKTFFEDLYRTQEINVPGISVGNSGTSAVLTEKVDNKLKFLENAPDKIKYLLANIESIDSIMFAFTDFFKFPQYKTLFYQVNIIKEMTLAIKDKLNESNTLISEGASPTYFDDEQSYVLLQDQYAKLARNFLELFICMQNSAVSIRKRNQLLLANSHQAIHVDLIEELTKALDNIIPKKEGDKLGIYQSGAKKTTILNLEQARSDGLYKLSFEGEYELMLIQKQGGMEPLPTIKVVVNVFISKNYKFIYNAVVSDDKVSFKPFLLSFTGDPFSDRARTDIEKDRSKLLEAKQKIENE